MMAYGDRDDMNWSPFPRKCYVILWGLLQHVCLLLIFSADLLSPFVLLLPYTVCLFFLSVFV